MKTSSYDSELHEIEREIERLLNDEVFERSPVMARLLTYLFEMTERGMHIKSFTIATDALGKAGDETSDADTYARVAVARLRRVLAKYYAARPGQDSIQIDEGSYRVKLVRTPEYERSDIAEDDNSLAAATHRLWSLIANGFWIWALAVALLAAAAAYVFLGAEEAAEDWTTSDFPRLAIDFRQEVASPDQDNQSQSEYRSYLTGVLSDYVGIRLLAEDGGEADFSLYLAVNEEQSNGFVQARLVDEGSGQVVWSERVPVTSDNDAQSAMKFIVTTIASPGGVITSLNRGRGLSTRSPYGCWLRFTEGLQTFNTIGDEELSRCASDWHAQSPGNSIAAFLYGWTLVNEAALTANPGEREPLLSEALRTANKAVALHPQEASLNVLQLRAHVLLGNSDLASQAAERALASAPDNRVIVGITGTLLTTSGNPAGEKILLELESEEGAALPWEHAGHFVAAMMRDDIAGANEHMVHLEQFAQGQPLLLLFKAAAASRSGKVEEARSAIEQLRGNPRMVGGDIDALIEGLSTGPNVKTRLKAWLAYSMSEPVSSKAAREQTFSR